MCEKWEKNNEQEARSLSLFGANALIRHDLMSSSPPIKLTKFAQLPEGARQVVLQLDRKGDSESSAVASSNKNQNFANGSSVASSKQQQPQFRLQWRNLAFELAPSAYEQLLDSARAHASAMLKWPRLSGCSPPPFDEKQQAAAAVAAQCKRRPSSGRVIFENLNGFANSGEICAILGPSGAGKTSLLNALCGRNQRNFRGSIELVTSSGCCDSHAAAAAHPSVGDLRGSVNDKPKPIADATEARVNHQTTHRLSIIPQKDYLIEQLSVSENLLYSSKILNPHESPEFHELNVARVVRMLKLGACLRAPAGKISGGEHKRVSIAQELLRQPDVLVLDEPTSGLDSLTCKHLVESLLSLTAAPSSTVSANDHESLRPLAIIMTIHQPDVEVFHLFHRVYCMARGGHVIFDGRPQDAMDYLHKHVPTISSSSSHYYKQQESWTATSGASCNPANSLIELASGELHGQRTIERLARLQRAQFEATVAKTAAATATTTTTAQTATKDTQSSQRPPPGQKKLVRDKRLRASQPHAGLFWYHTNLLARRAFLANLRDPLMSFVSLLFHLSLPFVMWSVYPRKIGSVRACPIVQRDMDLVTLISNKTMDQLEDLQEQLTTSFECSTMFFLTTYSFSMCSLTISAMAFPLSMHMLLKEVRNGWYRLPAFVAAKSLANFPFEVVFPVMSLIIIYLVLGMPSSPGEWRLGAIALVMALISMISHTQGLIFGALCMDSVQGAVFLASASSLPLTLLSGFTARVKHMPVIFQRLSWLSPYRYSSDLINLIRFGFDTCPCSPEADELLRTRAPTLSDLPESMKPLFTYYLTSQAQLESSSDNNNNSSISQLNNTTAAHPPSTVFDNQQQQQLALSPLERQQFLGALERNEEDLFARMADLMARSLSFGRRLDSCQSVRSQILITAGTPPDEQMPHLFGCMLALLLAAKVMLFFVVRRKIGARV